MRNNSYTVRHLSSCELVADCPAFLPSFCAKRGRTGGGGALMSAYNIYCILSYEGCVLFNSLGTS